MISASIASMYSVYVKKGPPKCLRKYIVTSRSGRNWHLDSNAMASAHWHALFFFVGEQMERARACVASVELEVAAV